MRCAFIFNLDMFFLSWGEEELISHQDALLCIYHWLFVLIISASFQQRDGYSNVIHSSVLLQKDDYVKWRDGGRQCIACIGKLRGSVGITPWSSPEPVFWSVLKNAPCLFCAFRTFRTLRTIGTIRKNYQKELCYLPGLSFSCSSLGMLRSSS